MNYQDKVLNNYQSLFPGAKLRETAEQTGIQLTRVFRIFNGAEMKISEFEAFETVLNEYSHNSSLTNIFKNLSEYIQILPYEKLIQFNLEIQAHMDALKYKIPESSHFFLENGHA